MMPSQPRLPALHDCFEENPFEKVRLRVWIVSEQFY